MFVQSDKIPFCVRKQEKQVIVVKNFMNTKLLSLIQGAMVLSNIIKFCPRLKNENLGHLL